MSYLNSEEGIELLSHGDESQKFSGDFVAELACEIKKLRQIKTAMKEQLDIATDLGQKRFEENKRLRALIAELVEDGNTIGENYKYMKGLFCAALGTKYARDEIIDRHEVIIARASEVVK